MALRIEVGNEDLTMSRFALSPLFELINALRLLAGAPGQADVPVLRPWLVRARDRYLALGRAADVGVILALLPPGWGPISWPRSRRACTPPSATCSNRVRSTPPGLVRRESPRRCGAGP